MFRRTPDLRPPAPHADVVDDLLVVTGAPIEAVLAEVERHLGTDVEVVDAQRRIVGGIAGFFGREQFVVRARWADSAVPADPEALEELEELEKFESLEELEEFEEPAPSAPLDGPAFAAELAETLRHARAEPPLRPPLAAAPSPAAPVAPLTPLAPAAPAPAEAPPEMPRDGIVAVVGDRADALSSAERIATERGLDPTEVLVAAAGHVPERPAWLTIADAADAARRSARWASADRLTVVAVVLEPGIDGLRWAADVLGALNAGHVRLAVSGWRRAEDVLPRLNGLGCVDAIDLCEPVESTAALGFLGLGVPVATIAGAPATPERWAEILTPAPTDTPELIP